MVVESFDPSAGVYAFQFQDMDTALHSHPAIEILFAEKGYFRLATTQLLHDLMGLYGPFGGEQSRGPNVSEPLQPREGDAERRRLSGY